MNIDFEDIFATLCREQNDPRVVRVLEGLGVGKRLVVEQSVYVDYFGEGVCFFFDENLCVSSIFFYSIGLDKHHFEYKGVFPMGLKFGIHREIVRRSFDQMLACSEGGGDVGRIPVSPWDKFAHEGHVLHVEYSSDNLEVRRVTISCGEGEVELPPLEDTKAGGLVSMLRNWFRPKTSGTKDH